jgi:hypothetical protein
MMIAAVGFDSLGLSWGALSESAAVGWNSAFIVAALSGITPGGPIEKRGLKIFNFQFRNEGFF